MTVLMLIIALPHSANANTGYAHVHSDGHSVLRSATGAAATLSTHAGEVVAVVPYSRLAWLRVQLPLASHGPRLQSVLHGLLEDRLLDDPQQLHIVLAPNAQDIARTGGDTLVAVCDKQWLAAHLAHLETAGITAHRIVPEFAPHPQGLHITAPGHDDSRWLWMSDQKRGVWGLPLDHVSAIHLGLTDEERQTAFIQAAPAVIATVSERLQVTPQLISPGQHWLAALQNGWDQAQFGFQAHPQARLRKTAQRLSSQLWHQPQWRLARWGVGTLLLSQLLGLNAWAWKTRNDWQAQQQSWTQILRESFPQTTVVVDAPLQMTQQVAQLRERVGMLGPTDLESMLSALGQALPSQLAAPRQWRFEAGQLRLSSWPLTATEQQSIQKALAAQGYTLRADGDAWLMRAQEGQP